METIFPSERVTIVAVLNATPDSFSDGGRYLGSGGRVRLEDAVHAADAMIDAGAHVLDVGGESTRPGAHAVSADVERARVVPLVEALAKRFAIPVSVDTRKATVAAEALDAGATIVNDVSGLAHDPGLAEVAAGRGATLILGHMRGTPETMQQAPAFEDAVSEVGTELAASVSRARAAGVPDTHICVDPGIGFGKNLEHNLKLLARVGALRKQLGLPVLVGPSRKAFLGALTGDPVGERDSATAAVCAVAAFAGVDAVRVHEVSGARRAVLVGRALREAAR